ncbi:transcriptional regulator [Candidatus Woesearchaeota archaeon]|nr:transcriptional regulator [Candidatus Woesearchaeota archaeon]
MPEIMPQEIAVWYLIPAIRRELSKELIKKGITQKKISRLLGVTEAAVSQYIKKKRAEGLKFSKAEQIKIEKTATSILKDEANSRKQIYNLSHELMGTKAVCRLHRSHDKTLKSNCTICFR